MKALGLALIAIGGGLVVYGVVRKLSAPAAEPGDPDYDELSEWERDLLNAEKQAPLDLNDGI